ncbi:MAG: hypothetical protein GWN58_39920 [Anaerolineae bacterium]|nr:hypothetical protein [Anaerolineae bacterium]
MVAFHRRYFHPNHTILGLWGDFETAKVKKLVESTFGSWARGEAERPPVPEVERDWDRSVNFIQKDDVNQTNLRIGHLGGRYDGPDYYALDVMAEILGGGLSSRLFRHVRSDLGLAYSVGAQWDPAYDYPGMFLVTCGTKSESTVQATQEILGEIRRLTEKPVTEQELRTAKEGILNSFVFNFDTTGEIVRRLVTYEYYGYPRDFLETFKANVEKVTAEDVLRVAQSHLKPGKLILLAVGRQQDFDQPLSTLGEVNTIDIAIPSPKPESAALPEATPESITRGREVLDRAIEGMGGLEALQGIRNKAVLRQTTQRTPQGEMEVTSKTTVVMPDKMRQDVVFGFGEISLVYDGERAWQETPRGVQDLPAERITELRQVMARSIERVLLDAHAEKRQVQFLEAANVQGQETDVIGVADPEGEVVKLYVARDTGRILKKANPARSPFHGPVEEETLYSDFRKIGSLRVPFKVVTLHNQEKAREATIQSYEVNIDLDPDLFNYPAGEAEKEK